ncbi:hypothetical protein TNCV_1220911 [Trichonephila clavipes]|nr:hypothetical protein TNCV_1220911 [Trichonephila clavipes]
MKHGSFIERNYQIKQFVGNVSPRGLVEGRGENALQPEIRKGVLSEEENREYLFQQLAMVIELILGRDGKIRPVIIKGTIVRLFRVGDRLTNRSVNTFTKDFYVRITNTLKKDFLCLDNEHIFGGDQRDTLEIMDEILTTAKDLKLEVNEDGIEELIMGHGDELTTEELQEILNEEHQETQRNVSF